MHKIKLRLCLGIAVLSYFSMQCQTDSARQAYFQSIDYYMVEEPKPINKVKSHLNTDSIYVKMPYINATYSSDTFTLYNHIAQSLVYKSQYYKINKDYLYKEEELDNDLSWIKKKEFIGGKKRWEYVYEKKNLKSNYILQNISIDKPYIKKTFYLKLDYDDKDERFLPENFNPSSYIIDVVEIENFYFEDNYLFDCKRKYKKDGESFKIIKEEYWKVKLTEDYYWYRSFPAIFEMKSISANKCKKFLNIYSSWEEIIQL